jgi:ribonuclease HI
MQTQRKKGGKAPPKFKNRVNHQLVNIDPDKPCIHVYTDGSAMKNGFGGPGTWAYAMIEGDKLIHEESSRVDSTTNNRMEMSAVLAVLLRVAAEGIQDQVLVHMDSSYVYNGITDWMYGWRNKNWKRGADDIPNRDLWEQIYTASGPVAHIVQYKWVKGHVEGERWNNYVDELCTAAYTRGTTVVVPVKKSAKEFLLESYLPNTEQYDRELWFNTCDWAQEIIPIMEKYKQL